MQFWTEYTGSAKKLVYIFLLFSVSRQLVSTGTPLVDFSFGMLKSLQSSTFTGEMPPCPFGNKLTKFRADMTSMCIPYVKVVSTQEIRLSKSSANVICKLPRLILLN